MDPKKPDDNEPKAIAHNTFYFVKGTLYAVSAYLRTHKPICVACNQEDVEYAHVFAAVTKALKLIEDDPTILAVLNERT